MRLSLSHSLTACLLLALTSITLAGFLGAQTCSKAPEPPALNPDESAVDTAFSVALSTSGGCMTASDAGCKQATDAFNQLSIKALSASGIDSQCAATGTYTSGSALSASDQQWYVKRSAFWFALYQSLQKQSATVSAGTYKIADPDRSAFLGVAPQAVAAAASTKQCNQNPRPWTDTDPNATPFSDCDMVTNIIGGVEQGAQSSLPSATTPFLRLFTRAGPDKLPGVQVWAYVRLLGAPQASSTSGVVSAVTDPAGNITTQTFSGIGTSVDFMLGGEYMFIKPKDAGYSASLIVGYGGTTPLTANNLNQAFKSPAFGTVECNTLQARFAQQFASDKITAGTSTNVATPSCLVNGNSLTSAASAATLTYTPISTIGFSNQDRTSFLGKAVIGLRTIDRFTENGNSYCGDPDATKQIGPCERGIVDFLFGQDASVTGGYMRHFVFKVDAVHPLPVKAVSFLYLFGSTTIRFHRNMNYAPLVLQSGDVASLTGNGANAVPNAGVVVLPLTQPDRDFYRFGVGININGIFKKLFTSPAPANTVPVNQ